VIGFLSKATTGWANKKGNPFKEGQEKLHQ